MQKEIVKNEDRIAAIELDYISDRIDAHFPIEEIESEPIMAFLDSLSDIANNETLIMMRFKDTNFSDGGYNRGFILEELKDLIQTALGVDK